MICRNHLDVAEGIRRCSRCGATFCPDCLVNIQGQPYCATCKTEQLLDVRSGVDRTGMNYATILKRFGAAVLDNIIQAIPMYAIMFGVIFGAGITQGNRSEPPMWILLMYVPMFLIPVLYEGLMLSLKNGQTVGKMALRVRVVRPDGSPISGGQAWGRAAMRVVLSCLWIVDYIPAFFTAEKTTLHDLVVGTRVVEEY